MTNGEKIKTILKPRTDQIRIYGDWVEIEIQSLGINFSCELRWWNAEYKEPTTKNDSEVDCVNRQFMYDLGATCVAYRNDKQELIPIISIDLLPSVTPQEPKTGHWVKTPKAVMGEGYMWYCDKCNHEVYQDTSRDYPSEKYCPNCGADMRGEEE